MGRTPLNRMIDGQLPREGQNSGPATAKQRKAARRSRMSAQDRAAEDAFYQLLAELRDGTATYPAERRGPGLVVAQTPYGVAECALDHARIWAMTLRRDDGTTWCGESPRLGGNWRIDPRRTGLSIGEAS